jgi:hypothetical protein
MIIDPTGCPRCRHHYGPRARQIPEGRTHQLVLCIQCGYAMLADRRGALWKIEKDQWEEIVREGNEPQFRRELEEHCHRLGLFG